MQATEYLHKQIKSMHYLQDSTLGSLDDEVITRQPGGTTSAIGLIWLHMVNGEDSFIATIMGKSSLWNTEGWKERFGLKKAPNIGEDWRDYKDAPLTVKLLRDYMAAVRAATQSCLETLTAADLDQTTKFFTESDPKADVWVLLVTHSLIHTGEIAALKGVMGKKGLPF